MFYLLWNKQIYDRTYKVNTMDIWFKVPWERLKLPQALTKWVDNSSPFIVIVHLDWKIQKPYDRMQSPIDLYEKAGIILGITTWLEQL